MLAKTTKRILDKEPPPKGPCGGIGIWFLTPRRHWCKMTDAEVALHLLAGLTIHEKWDTVEKHDDAWINGSIVLKRRDGYDSVVLNSKCRWVKTETQNGRT